MDGIRRFIEKLPPWSLSGVTLAVILWLTLAPQPLGEETPELFPGADKVAHGIMFGFLLLMVLVDRSRNKDRNSTGLGFVAIAAGCVILLGIIIEILQGLMGMGRSFDAADIYADSAGAVVVASGWMIGKRMG